MPPENARKFRSMPLSAHSGKMKPISQRLPFLNELTKEGEALAKPRGVPLSAWEDLEKQKSKPNELSTTSTVLLDLPSNRKIMRRRYLTMRRSYARRFSWKMVTQPMFFDGRSAGSFVMV